MSRQNTPLDAGQKNAIFALEALIGTYFRVWFGVSPSVF
jgi:hypothetical protein